MSPVSRTTAAGQQWRAQRVSPTSMHLAEHCESLQQMVGELRRDLERERARRELAERIARTLARRIATRRAQ